jgi:hypothetical protein
MEFSYLNAVVKTAYFPPYDPWYAGGYLNYYYFGYVLVAALTKLTGVMPSIGFNLAVATLYAFTAAGSFSFVYNLSRLGGRPALSFRAAVAAGVAGFALVALAGNLDGYFQLLARLAQLGAAARAAIPALGGRVAVVFGGPHSGVRYGVPRASSPTTPSTSSPSGPFCSPTCAHLISIPSGGGPGLATEPGAWLQG